jgi:site-specific DNA-cytosine methylase
MMTNLPYGSLPPTSRSAVAFGHTNGIDVQASEGVTPTLRVDPGGASVATASVRRLTPVECERLQGYPDEWTLKRAELVQAGNRWEPTGTVLEQADAPRYRQLGNSIAVPVFVWIAEGIMLVEDAG